MANKALLHRLEREALTEELEDYFQGLSSSSQSSLSTPTLVGTVRYLDGDEGDQLCAHLKPAQTRRQKKHPRWVADRPADHVPSIEDL